MTKKQKIYRAYLTREEGITAQDIAQQFGISRRAVHQAIDEVQSGDTQLITAKERVKMLVDKNRKKCLWQARYIGWYRALGNLKNHPALVEDFTRLLLMMKKDGFSPAEMAYFTGKDHSTIRHHLK